MSRIIISVTNDLGLDQRINRVATTLQAQGHEVLAVGRRHSRTVPLDDRPYQTLRLNMFFETGKLFYLEYNLRLLFFLLFQKVDILLANDLDTLAPNALVAFIRRKRLVYDSHEFFTEVPELLNRRLTRAIWLFIEKLIFPWLKYVYTVNESIAKEYRKKYGVEVGVIRNLPFRRQEVPTPDLNQKILIYQGAMNVGRGIDLMIRSLQHLPGYTLWVIGFGNHEEPLKELANELELGERVLFKGFVPPDDLAALTPQACIGFSLEENLGKNFYYALPNKLFDYIQCGVPVIVSDLPEMKSVVEQYEVGKVLPEENRTPEALAELIQELVEVPKIWNHYHDNCQQASVQLCWEAELNRLLTYYAL